MGRRRIAYVIACGFLASFFAAARPARAQVIVVTARSAGECIDDLHYLIEAGIPLPDAGDALKGLDQLRNPKAASGLDLKRPLGAFVDIEPVPVVTLFVPLADPPAFLKSLQASSMKVVATPEGVAGFSHRVSFPKGEGPDLYLLITDNVAYLTTVPSGAERLRALKPADLVDARPGAGLIHASVRVDRVPAQMKQAMLAQAQFTVQAEKDRRPDENEAQYHGRLVGMKVTADAMTSLFNEGREVTADLDIDPKTGAFSFDVDVEALPDTKLAAALASFGARKSLFRGLAKDAALAAWVDVPVANEVGKLFMQGFEQGFGESLEQAKDPKQKALAKQVAEALHPTLTANEVDLGVAWYAPTAANGAASKSVILWGIKVKDGKQLEAKLIDLLKQADPKKGGSFELNVAKAGDGKTAIHRVVGPGQADEILGKQEVFFAVSGDVFMMSLGENGQTILIQELDRARAQAPGADEPTPAQVEMTFTAGKLDKFQAPPPVGEPLKKAFDAAFTGPNAGKDHLKLQLSGGEKTLDIRLQCDVPVLGFLTRFSQERNAPEGAVKP